MYQQPRTPQVFTVFGNMVFDGGCAPVEPNRRKIAGGGAQSVDGRRWDESLLAALGWRLAA